ncbi:uncharacterized protein LOC128720099 [Anopheles nili]|uniref:uncharacterized protein LOC128720099 n=1 Tax=Anopheles nili TaxID=185578 RepID=UPI00237A7A11|nr:uncharacterized protein LOC128720099 [Anopheles nili]
MSSSASSSTAGNSAAGTAPNQAGQPGRMANGADGGGHGNSGSSGTEGSVLEKQGPPGGGPGGVGHTRTDPDTSSPAHHRSNGGGTVGGTANTTGTVLRRKTNVCLICGIYTNLSLNIFEPRNGPNIVDVIYEKYKFRAERGDNADKHICFSCNNWLINWYSLQNTSSGSSRTYEPAPSTSRSSSAADSSNNSRHGRHHGHKPRTKATLDHSYAIDTSSSSSRHDKENRQENPRSSSENLPRRGRQFASSYEPDQHGQVSSTTHCPGEAQEKLVHPYHHVHPYSKRASEIASSNRRSVLKERNGQRNDLSLPHHRRKGSSEGGKDDIASDMVSSSTEQGFDAYTMLVKPFESQLIRMLEGQGTSVTKEPIPQIGADELQDRAAREKVPWHPRHTRMRSDRNGNIAQMMAHPYEDGSKEIVLSFDSALSEVIDVVPSLKAMQSWRTDCSTNANDTEDTPADPVGPLRQQLCSGALSVSIICNADMRAGKND